MIHFNKIFTASNFQEAIANATTAKGVVLLKLTISRTLSLALLTLLTHLEMRFKTTVLS